MPDMNENKVKCQNCGQLIRSEAQFCLYCGEKQVPPVEEQPPAVDGNRVSCSNCGKLIRDDVQFCLYCGAKQVPAPEGKIKCPKCGKFINEDAQFCLYCGEQQALAPYGNQSRCPNCGKLVRDDAQACTYCGEPVLPVSGLSEFDKDPYEILQVSGQAEQGAIDDAFRALMRQYQPGSDIPGYDEKYRDIIRAHDLLTDPVQLAEWKSRHGRGSGTTPPVETGPDTPELQAPPGPVTPALSPEPGNQQPVPDSPFPKLFEPAVTSLQDGQKRPAPKKGGKIALWISGGIMGLALVIVCLAVVIPLIQDATSRPRTSYSSPVVEATSTQSQAPANSSSDDCLAWDEITPAMEGWRVCAYGGIAQIYDIEDDTMRIKFSEAGNTFFIDLPASTRYTNGNGMKKIPEAGDCVVVEDVVQVYGSIPYMSVTELLLCEP